MYNTNFSSNHTWDSAVYNTMLNQTHYLLGVLKTPVRRTCGMDPCVGKFCTVDRNARCFTDFRCKSTFWSLNFRDEIIQCRGTTCWWLSLSTNTSSSHPSLGAHPYCAKSFRNRDCRYGEIFYQERVKIVFVVSSKLDPTDFFFHFEAGCIWKHLPYNT